jgi:hypothetical protein
MTDDYEAALVCRRGHVESWWSSVRKAPPARCAECGSPILSACPECGHRIRGGWSSGYHEPERLSDFCDKCGAPYPWASRRARIYELENRLDDDETLDDATRLRIRDELDQLAEDDGSDPTSEKERWTRVKKLWPNVATVGQTVLTTILTAELKRQMGLPP